MMQIDEIELGVILGELRGVLGVDGVNGENGAEDMEMVAGDVVEMGCYRGETAVELGRAIKGSGKNIWLFDSFAGLPAPTVADGQTDFRRGDLATTADEVYRRFKKAGLPEPYVVEGFFEKLDVDDLPEEICFALLDGDLYESIRASLELVASRSPKVIVVHDFGNVRLPGVRRAVMEWLRGHGEYTLRTVGTLAIIKS